MEGFSRLVIAGGDTAKLLQLAEHPLDTVAISVTTEIAGDIFCTI
ncbi:hypothetical protein AOE01nite_26250 [Acetobacter oeni]|uniref:Uncharacterized protein n=1 Tax=Acetobacter oeni TaxID=304077 RepID=A0A511XN78_9PROT|nr:hypothetical protein [Acetobacter oeni]GEN64401.1 hypothetical protein AOE01nite_26250 [Acetobacter oeni]